MSFVRYNKVCNPIDSCNFYTIKAPPGECDNIVADSLSLPTYMHCKADIE